MSAFVDATTGNTETKMAYWLHHRIICNTNMPFPVPPGSATHIYIISRVFNPLFKSDGSKFCLLAVEFQLEYWFFDQIEPSIWLSLESFFDIASYNAFVKMVMIEHALWLLVKFAIPQPLPNISKLLPSLSSIVVDFCVDLMLFVPHFLLCGIVVNMELFSDRMLTYCDICWMWDYISWVFSHIWNF